jgi:archaellum component FlaF (FlaF/FlaG flagellin family)
MAIAFIILLISFAVQYSHYKNRIKSYEANNKRLKEEEELEKKKAVIYERTSGSSEPLETDQP